MRDFPQELTDLILDKVAAQDRRTAILGGRRTSIATCGLVCKNWLPRSRLHIFSQIILHGSRLNSLLDLETKSFLPLLPLAQDLLLIFGDLSVPEEMTRIRECLSLRRLELYSVDGNGLYDLFVGTHLPFLGTHCSWLSSMTLNPCEKSAVSLCMIADILTCLPSLHTFTLVGQSNSIIAAEIPTSYSCPPRLHTLDITVKSGVDILFAWFLSLAVPPRIKSLTLSEDLDDAPSSHALVAYSQKFSAELEFLSVWPRRASFDTPSGILKYATTLLHLNLRCQHISTVLPLLSALPSSRLRTLAIELDVRLAEGRVDSDVNLVRVPYALIDAALAHPRFYALERLSLTTYSVERETRSLLSRKAKALMPLAKARGILHRYRR
ncbi:hypothetical protein B0H13DRAFT_2651701 [Mycena leptocephala]|nr:hypothetical protein B0H13DRAFT_2651701 [Mycena leptocephala]